MGARRELVDPADRSARTMADVRQGGSRPVRWRPGLLLAFGADGVRGPEWLTLDGDHVELGRSDDVFPGGPLADLLMSRRHLALRRLGATWQVEDLGSRNGTRVNGSPVQGTAPLSDGDVLRTGDTAFLFVAYPPAEPTQDDHLVGCSDATVALRRTLDKVAPHDTTVLLTGETGTGKEVAALYLHRQSGRRGPFVAVNCAALSSSVLESELFGHRKGAFTGADADREGLFRAADGGTLLLDEVGELPPGFQAKLLRVLETGVVRPLGDTRPVKTEVRIVAATNRDLLAEVRAGRFRSDLYARLVQWPLKLTPLRERRDDIPVLTRHVLGLAEPPRPLSADLAEALLLHDWPLNVRELTNVVSIAAIASPGVELALGPEVQRALEAGAAIASDLTESDETLQPDDSGETSRPTELPSDDRVDAALRECRGRVAAAARSLGLSRQQLYRWLSARERTADDYR